jgi:hypothetical protein
MARSQPFTISCDGGLINTSNSLELLKTPGFATKLKNFEVNISGGYRRINGFTKFGGTSATKPNTTEKVLGIFVYGDGVIVCSGTDIFFSEDGTSWLQINRDSVSSSGDNYATFTGRSVLTRTNQGQCSFALYEGNYDYGELIICDGVNLPFLFRMEGTGALSTRTFFATELTVDSTVGPVNAVIHDHHLVVDGGTDEPNTIYWARTDEPAKFGGSGADNLALPDQVVGLRSFRNDLIIFCKNSIHKLININDTQTVAIVPVTTNVGCLNGKSIQEIAGDLLFLAPDGFRTVAGTSRIGDVELSTVSKQIQTTIKNIANTVSDYTISSVVIREKSQYRLFYSKATDSAPSSQGVIGVIRPNGFQWSETLGIQATAITSGFNDAGIETYYHGDNSGNIYVHDNGNDFDGTAIAAEYQTPDIDYGDLGTLKTLHFVKISIGPEGSVQPNLKVRYDYNSNQIPQPAEYVLENVPAPSIFGEVLFGTAVFGATEQPFVRQPIQGSGHSNFFNINSEDSNAPYTINGLYIDYIPSGRR